MMNYDASNLTERKKMNPKEEITFFHFEKVRFGEN